MDNPNLPSQNTEAQIAEYQAQPMAQPKQYIEYCSIDPKTASKEDKLKLFNALKKCDGLVQDSLDQDLELTNIYFKTFYSGKEQKDKSRVILFLADGRTLVSGSFPLLNSLMQLMKTFGEPKTWTEPMKIRVTTVKAQNGQAFTVEVLG